MNTYRSYLHQLLNLNPTAVVATVVLVPAVLFGLLYWNFDQPPFDLARLKRLHEGMSREEVRTILGEPSGRDDTAWHYSRPFAWPVVHVRFDASGKLVSHDYDY